MDTLKDFFSDLKDRISNPFISSFVIAWVLRNYPVVITLLFYKQSELQADKYNSYLDVIHKNYSSNHMIWFPLCVALIYTFLFPFVKSGIRLFNTWILTKTDGLVYKMTKNEVVSVEIHSQVVRDSELTKADYVKAINKQKESSETIDELTVRISEAAIANTKLINDLNIQHDQTVEQLTLQFDSRVEEIRSSLSEDNEIIRKELEASLEDHQKLSISNYNLINDFEVATKTNKELKDQNDERFENMLDLRTKILQQEKEIERLGEIIQSYSNAGLGNDKVVAGIVRRSPVHIKVKEKE